MSVRRQAGWAIAALAVAIGLVSSPALAGRHDDRWRHERERDRDRDRWREHHDYVAPPVVYAPGPVVAAPALSFMLHIR